MTIAWETASKLALGNCSKEVGERPVYTVILAKGYMQSSIHLGGRLC